MGRFDILTQLDNKPLQHFPIVKEKEVPQKQIASKLASQQTNKEVNQQVSKQVNTQTNKSESKQTSLSASQQTNKLLKKFGSYLTEDSLRGLKRIAFETDRKDYEVLQEAVDQYLQRGKK